MQIQKKAAQDTFLNRERPEENEYLDDWRKNKRMVVKVAVPQQFKLKVIPDIRSLLFGGQKEIHYIGGTEILPPPLEGTKETEVIRRLGTEYDEEAKRH